jgi:anti-sigma factor ChrR (cupin superfamily)
MAPGSFYPPHHHTSIEHTFVIEGDIVFDGYTLEAGEYQAALPDTDHDKPITTKNGCTVLIINNANDEVFAMPPAQD